VKILIALILLYAISIAKVDYENYCKSDTKRETHIIIDLNNIDNILYGKVVKNLSYAPHEKVTLYYYDNTTKSIVKNYTFCNPLLSQSEIKKIDDTSFVYKALGTDIDKMEEHQMFLKSKLINRLVKMQTKISNNSKSNFIDSFSTITNDIDEQSRIIIFTNEKFSKKSRSIDLKHANVYIYQKRLPSKKIIAQQKDYFAACNAYLKTIYTRPTVKENTLSLTKYKLDVTTIIEHRKMKSNITITANKNGKIVNGWFFIYGVLQAPIEGTIEVSGDKIITLNSKVPTNFKYKNNLAYKGDHIDINRHSNEYSGKYYNYAYAFQKDNFQYFQYRIEE